MLYKLVERFPEDMIFKEEGPLVSLYQPTHRIFPDNKQDVIVYKNLLRTIENSLKLLVDDSESDELMKPLYEIKDDKEFWNNTYDGLAILVNKKNCIVYKLREPVKELAIVANSYYVKPLIKAFQALEQYQVLGLSRENFNLYQGNRYGFEELVIDEDQPKTMEDVLGDQKTESYLSHGSYGGTGAPTMYHGHDDPKQEADKDTEKYFRYVDQFVYEHYSKKAKLPLILIALSQYHSYFRTLSNNPYLIQDGIDKSIESMNLSEIRASVADVIERINKEKYEKNAEAYAQANANSLGASDIAQIAKAAFEGRVKTIMIEEDKIVSGSLDFETGKITFGDIDKPDNSDVINELVQLVLLNGGEVLVLSKAHMPSETGVAAIYRYN